MKTISNIERLTPKDYFGIADRFKLSYVGRYVAEKSQKEPVDVWEISSSIKDLGEFWSIPIRFVSGGTTAEELTKMLEDNKFEVSHITPSYLGGGVRLLYRDIRELPMLKLGDTEEKKSFEY